MKIIITWWAGFIGSNFLNKFVLLYPKIDFINIDILSYAWSQKNINQKVKNSSNYFFENVDILNIDDLKKVYKKYNPTDIIHFAAESHVDNSIENPFIFTKTNIIWTQNLLELHKEFWLNRFHHVSTDEVYGDLDNFWFFTENSPLNPSNPYSASKAWSDVLVKSYWRTFGINYVITRSSNNYWPNQHNEKLIPHFINLLKNNKPVTIYWDWSNIRDWIYVEDNCDAIWEVFMNAKNNSIYNIAWNNEYSNLELTKIIINEMWKNNDYISFVQDRKWHDFRYALDISKIKNDLLWEPKVDFQQGIIKTIKYYLNN